MRCNFRRGGFTLIELLAVVVIILILAGIVLGLVKFANEKASRAKAEGELAAMATAMESYKTDNGAYPKESVSGDAPGATDLLDARLNAKPTEDVYKKASAVLYRALSGDPGVGNTVYGKTYYNVPSSMMSTATIKVGNVESKYLIDPFGNSYGYSTANEYQSSHASSTQDSTSKGFNPTYDLWSTAGYGATKDYPTDATDISKKTVFWLKNW